MLFPYKSISQISKLILQTTLSIFSLFTLYRSAQV